jgi:hypothetical protein
MTAKPWLRASRSKWPRAIDRYLDGLDAEDEPDRRNGYYRRHLLTTLGAIELCVPRTRRYSPAGVLRAYARQGGPTSIAS